MQQAELATVGGQRKSMPLASLVSEGAKRNNIFDPNSPSNRDDCLKFCRELRNEFLRRGIELNTMDVNHGSKCQIELHFDARQPPSVENSYLILFESPVVYPNNGEVWRFEGFRKIFTWNDDLVASNPQLYIKANFPGNTGVLAADSHARDRLCCMIAGNKTVPNHDPRELYSERVRVIRWFERHQPQDFDLFGVGWNTPGKMPGLLGRAVNKALSIFPSNSRLFFPSYGGAVDSKADTYARYLFSICYENVQGLHGYITEKIFDAMCSGCIPVYWGAANVTDYIPADCFIDRRKFSNNDELYVFLKNMGEKKYLRYRAAILDFLSSSQARQFSADAFSITVVNAIVHDLRERGIGF